MAATLRSKTRKAGAILFGERGVAADFCLFAEFPHDSFVVAGRCPITPFRVSAMHAQAVALWKSWQSERVRSISAKSGAKEAEQHCFKLDAPLRGDVGSSFARRLAKQVFRDIRVLRRVNPRRNLDRLRQHAIVNPISESPKHCGIG